MSNNEKIDACVVTGVIEDVVYFNESNGYCVCEINTGEDSFNVVGEIGELVVGEHVEFVGEWTTHKSFGRQFKAITVRHTLPADADGILKYLSSGIIKGIGPSTAMKIVSEFSVDTFNVIENEPDRLATIKGISRKKANEISKNFKIQFATREIMLGLTTMGLTQAEAIKAYSVFKDYSLDIISENPYVLIDNNVGIPFERVDEIVEGLNEKPSYDYRMQAGIVHIVRYNLSNGHTCIPRDKMFKPAKALLDCNDDAVDIAIDNAIVGNMLVEQEFNGRKYLFVPEIYVAESTIAQRISIMANYPPQETEIFDSDIYAFEMANNIAFDEKQRKAVEIAVSKGLLILTGGPGTGKTTTVKGIISLMKNRGLNVALAAPTGRAAQRMEELTGYEAKTIHRLLEVEYKDSSENVSFVHNIQNPLDCDAVIVDELSMVDVTLFAALLDALPLHCRLIMVGDVNQLPPVGAGNVLSDLIISKKLDVVVLDKVFRQALESNIIKNAHRVVKGKMPIVDNGENSDFFILKEISPDLAQRKIVDLVTKRLPTKYGYDPVTDIQVLCPSRQGPVGTKIINTLLQYNLNPSSDDKNELHFKGYILREGDKVMQVKNNYDVPWFKSNDEGHGVFNGDIGVLTKIDTKNDIINVKFDDKEAMYCLENAKEIELAYAMTVHKSQGSEFEAVVMPTVATPYLLSYRNLFYTALTRAKKLLVLVGNEQSVKNMVDNDKKSRRYSALKYLLNQN